LKKILPSSADLRLANEGILQLKWENAMHLGSEESAAAFTKIADHMTSEVIDFLKWVEAGCV